jgi:hypothetical protein
VNINLKARIQADLNAARKGRDKAGTVLLSTLLSEIRNREIEARRELGEDEVVGVVTRAVKQRRDSADQMRAGGRPELADGEEAEADALKTYLPEQLDEGEVRALVRAAIDAGADAIGPLMARLVPSIKGRFDGKEANRIAREELGR